MRYIISSILATLLLAMAARAEVPRVATDIPPVHSLVAIVMGDLGQPQLLVAPGADAHSFQLAPSQATSLQEAQLIVWIGPEMTPWLERTLDGLAPNAARIGLLDAAETETQAFGEGGEHAHDDDKAEAQSDQPAGEEAAEDAHGHDGIDPHAWLDPSNAKAWLGLIAAELSRLDPENAAIYAANAADGETLITATETEITAILSPVKDRPFVVYHDAYGYFSGHFGLTIAGEIAVGDATSPSAARLAELRQTLVANAAACIFPEANHDPKLLQQLTEGTAVATGAALDPEGAGLAAGPELYGKLMLTLARSIADCLAKA